MNKDIALNTYRFAIQIKFDGGRGSTQTTNPIVMGEPFDITGIEIYRGRNGEEVQSELLTLESIRRKAFGEWTETLQEIIGDIEPEGSNYYASMRNGLRRTQYEKARELGFDIKPQEEKVE